MIDIDGSFGSGGGAILRTATALSAITGEEVRVYNIRAGRPNPGLQAQHLEGLKAIAELCDGKLRNVGPGSEEISFTPGKISSKEINIKIGTAGSIGLIFQTLALPAGLAEREVTINVSGGATFGKWAPPLLTTRNILLPILGKMGYKADIKILKNGFYPAGGANAEIRIHPFKNLQPLHLEKLGKITFLGGASVSAIHLKSSRVAERQAREAEAGLKKFSPIIKEEYVQAECPGSGIVLWATDGKCILGSDCIGERGKRAEDIGREASLNLLRTINSGCTVDEKISDQVLLFMALAEGRSKVIAPRLTNHAKTNIWLIKKFLGTEFKTVETQRNVTIECEGNNKLH